MTSQNITVDREGTSFFMKKSKFESKSPSLRSLSTSNKKSFKSLMEMKICLIVASGIQLSVLKLRSEGLSSKKRWKTICSKIGSLSIWLWNAF